MRFTPRDVSVLIPAYNAAPYIGELLDSLGSRVGDLGEVILYDDASSDATYEIAKSFSFVSAHRGTENRGCAFARNWLLYRSRFPIVHFHDADDPFVDDAFYSELPPLVSSDTAAFCAWRLIYGDGRELVHRYATEDNFFVAFIDKNPQSNSVLYPREALIAFGGVDQGFRYQQDVLLNLSLLGNGVRFRYFDKVMATYAKRMDSSTFLRTPAQNLSDKLEILKCALHLASDNDKPSVLRSLAHNCRSMALEGCLDLMSIKDIDWSGLKSTAYPGGRVESVLFKTFGFQAAIAYLEMRHQIGARVAFE